jgi:hypothetical protein
MATPEVAISNQFPSISLNIKRGERVSRKPAPAGGRIHSCAASLFAIRAAQCLRQRGMQHAVQRSGRALLFIL